MKRKKIVVLILSMFLAVAISGSALAALSTTFSSNNITSYRVSQTSIGRNSGQPWSTFRVKPSVLSYTGYSRNTAYATPCTSGGSLAYADRKEITRGFPTSYGCYEEYRYELNVWVALRNGFYTDDGNGNISMRIEGTFSGQY